MHILRSPREMQAWRRSPSGRGGNTLGCVPTMGFLHQGHLSLVQRAREDNDLVAVTLFVNPTQFGEGEDFEDYPRDEARDVELLEDAGVDALYLPAPEEMYPSGFQSLVRVEGVSARLEGAARPTHFQGVTTVVLKLLNAVQPDRAYFGKKDAQQLRVIRRMVADLDLAVEIVGCETVREPDGLAMSSRNTYLQPEERLAALSISRGLMSARSQFEQGERDADRLRATVRESIEAEPAMHIDYVSLADDVSLEELSSALDGPALLSVAARIGKTRLIDNVELGGS